MISKRLGAADESFGFIEASFTPPGSDCKAAFGAWFNLWLPPLCLVPGKTRQQNCEGILCRVVHLGDIMVQGGAVRVLRVQARGKKQVVWSRSGRELDSSCYP